MILSWLVGVFVLPVFPALPLVGVSPCVLEVGELTGGGVGGEGLEPPAVGVGEGELRSGMWSFPADQHPRPFRPAGGGEVTEPAGQLGHLGAVAQFPVGLDRLGPGLFGQRQDHGLHRGGHGEPDRERRSKPWVSRIRRRWVSQALVAPAPSAQTRIGVPCR